MNKFLNLSTPQISMLLVLVNLLVYGQVVGFEFVNYDDAFYVENVHVKNGLTWKGVAWAFSIQHNFSQYLNWISHMVDVELFGRNPAGHHAVSLLLHAANTVLFFLFLSKLTGSRNASAVVALLFAIHPLRVETVAWVADRKDLLAMFFALLSLEAYRRYARSPNIQRYAFAALCFLLALLSKPVMVVLPFVFLLIDYWPLNRIDRDTIFTVSFWKTLRPLIVEKIPLFLILGLFYFLIVQGFELRNMGGKTSSIPFEVRLAMMPVLYMKYLFHIIWPADLSAFYPTRNLMPPLWQWGGSLVILLGLTGAVLAQAKRRPYLAVGWFWFAGSLLPMAGLFRTGDHAMADRYTYFPLIGLFILTVWGLAHWDFMKKRAAFAAGGVLVLALMTVSFVQTGVWKNSITLFEHAIEVDDANAIAHNNLATAWMQRDHPEKAVPHLQKAVKFCPRCIEAWLNLGMSYKSLQQAPAAIDAFLKVLEVMPDNIIAHEELGALYHVTGDGPGAIRHTRKAEAIYSELFGPDNGTAVALRRNLAAYYHHYGIPPKS